MNFLIEDNSEPEVSTHTIWTERYRPSKLEDYVGNETLKAKIKQYIETNDIPHLLLYGGAGTGKTTLAKLITNSIKCDMLYINASDENGIDTVRVKIKNFACNIGFNPLKVIVLDECLDENTRVWVLRDGKEQPIFIKNLDDKNDLVPLKFLNM
jgi:replication-associated recombination protein RarA